MSARALAHHSLNAAWHHPSLFACVSEEDHASIHKCRQSPIEKDRENKSLLRKGLTAHIEAHALSCIPRSTIVACPGRLNDFLEGGQAWASEPRWLLRAQGAQIWPGTGPLGRSVEARSGRGPVEAFNKALPWPHGGSATGVEVEQKRVCSTASFATPASLALLRSGFAVQWSTAHRETRVEPVATARERGVHVVQHANVA